MLPPKSLGASGEDPELVSLRRFLVLGEETDDIRCPDWYASMQAAKYIDVPWPDFLHLSIWYQQKALIAMSAEKQARDMLSKHGK